MEQKSFHVHLESLMDQFAHGVYRITRKFPSQEKFTLVTQLRRAALSVILNYKEGFARRNGNKIKVHRNFLEIAYGSLQESLYLLRFSHKEGFIDDDTFNRLFKTADEIGAMLYTTMRKL